MFKVVPDQLRVSDGWVRCGQCDEVFDANAHLQAPAQNEPAVSAPIPAPPAFTPAAPSATLSASYDWSPIILGASSTAAMVAVTESDSAEESADVGPVWADEVNLSDIIPSDDRLTELLADPVAYSASGAPSVDAQPEIHETPTASFLRANQTVSAPRHRGMVVLLAMGSAVLLAVLVAQVLVQERDRIAATEPAAAALLEPLCAVMNCRISPLKQIDAMVIESSAFAKIRPDLYRLSITIKNTALVDLATPALELTLTDMQDQALFRRVLTAQDLGTQRPVLTAGGEWVASLSVGVKLLGDVDRIAGYRLLTFYP